MLFMYNVLIHSQLYNQANPEAHSATATMSTSPATDAAMSTTELLEQILSHLGVEDLILLRRVSRHWRNVMAGSLILQRAMFLAPEPELPFEWYLQWMNFGEPWRYIKKTSGAVLEHYETVVMKSSHFNPVLYKRRPKVESRGVSNGWQSVRLYIRNNPLTAGGTSLFPQMFITQPPVTHALVGHEIELHNEHGIRVADIIRALEQKYGSSCKPYKSALSLVVPGTMFPSTEEETEGLIIRASRLRPASLYAL